jgi:hypothetical protein
MGTTLWKTVCAVRESLAWRGLQRGACERGSGQNFSEEVRNCAWRVVFAHHFQKFFQSR